MKPKMFWLIGLLIGFWFSLTVVHLSLKVGRNISLWAASIGPHLTPARHTMSRVLPCRY
jgi:hypothetical protein